MPRVKALLIALALVPALVSGCFGASDDGPCPGLEAFTMPTDAMRPNVTAEGTIDKGDILCLEAFPPAREQGGFSSFVSMFVQNPSGRGPGGPFGDVIVFHPDGDTNRTEVRRLISWTTLGGDAEKKSYFVLGYNSTPMGFGGSGIYYPPWGFNETNGFVKEKAYKAPNSGYLTYADNFDKHRWMDQATGAYGPVTHDQVIGRVNRIVHVDPSG